MQNMSASNRKRLVTYPILAFAIFGLAFATACGTDAEAAARDRICGTVDTITTDTAWMSTREALPNGMQVIHFADGRVLRTVYVPSTELVKGNSYVFPTGGVLQSAENKTFYRLTGAVSRVSSCDSIPKAPAKK